MSAPMEWLVVGLVAILAIIAVATMAKQRRVERARLAQLEAQTEAIMRQYGVPDPADPQHPYGRGQFSTPHPADPGGAPELPSSQDQRLQQVQRLALDGQKIQAIKQYREITGAGLAEAKRVVEMMSRPY